MGHQVPTTESENVIEQPFQVAGANQMNIGQIHGTGGVDKGRDQSQSTKVGKRQHDQSPVQDSASISEASREFLRDFEGISGRLHDDASDRKDLVSEVKGRLESGYLDQKGVYRDVARSILTED